MSQPVRVLLLEDEELVRVSIKMILESSGRIDVVADRADGIGAVDLVTEYRPDVVVTDIRMPIVDGLAVTRAVRALPEPPPVLLLTTFDLDEYVYEALAAGAAGFLLKDTPPRDLISGVEVVTNGNAVLAPSVIKRMVARFATGPGARPVSTSNRLDVLTDREREVVRLVATGASNADIAGRLLLSEATVKVHVRHATAKLGLDNRTQLAILVYQENDTL
ncbi:MAG TPA: response regulator transcription factor [Pseudonocardiaceae bacterium]|nr:response regulator transcription factor [Pseudonocardiaceae bacterium]